MVPHYPPARGSLQPLPRIVEQGRGGLAPAVQPTLAGMPKLRSTRLAPEVEHTYDGRTHRLQGLDHRLCSDAGGR